MPNQKSELLGERTGKVGWYNRHKGYGFVHLQDGTQAFVHVTGLADPEIGLEPGTQVSFLLYKGARGLYARKVLILT
jgi:cold shock protein